MGKHGSFIKRFTDILFSLLTLLIFSPLLLICMLMVKLESKGPAIFVQKRVGVDGKIFNMYKLRGMVDKAESLGPALTQVDDPRLTKTGKLFRRLSIDELPQVVNVLLGDMSIVGPRPEVISLTEDYTDEMRQIFKYKPGITGISQLNGRQTLTPEKRIKMELEYYSQANFFTDLMLVLKTPYIVFTNEGNI